jgi:hypothetical protein
MAIQSVPSKKLTLSEIYQYLQVLPHLHPPPRKLLVDNPNNQSFQGPIIRLTILFLQHEELLAATYSKDVGFHNKIIKLPDWIWPCFIISL